MLLMLAPLDWNDPRKEANATIVCTVGAKMVANTLFLLESIMQLP
jgi:hypothetical protein